MDNPSIYKEHPSIPVAVPVDQTPKTGESIVADCQWHARQSAQLLPQTSYLEAVKKKKTSAESQPYVEAIMMTGLPEFEYAGMFNSTAGNKGSPTEGNYWIDLDGMDGAPSPLDVVGSGTEKYGIDLD